MGNQDLNTLQSGYALLAYYGLSESGTKEASNRNSFEKQATGIIRDRILDLTLSPGSRIDDKMLIARFGLGRTPAREALNRLAAEGLIIMQRHKGAFVRHLDIPHIRQLFDAYISSERIVGYFSIIGDAELANRLESIEEQYQEAYAKRQFLKMTQLNARFHGHIAVATQNEYIAEYALRLYNSARRLSYFVYLTGRYFDLDLQNMQSHIKSHHDEIVAVVREGDNERLIDVLTRHSKLFHDRVIDAISETHAETSPLPIQLGSAP